MINLIVWSKDRACQLDCLLRSLPINFFNKVYVIYKTSDDNFQKGYEKLSARFQHVIFIKEVSLHDQTMEVIGECLSSTSKIALSTDDTVFFKNPPMTPEEVVKSMGPQTVTFSFRYGFNTIVQDCHIDSYQPSLNIYQDCGDYISWNSEYYHPLTNYGYPFGLDMHVYDAQMLYNLANQIDFKNTNQLESGLFHLRVHAPKIINSFKHSVAVNIPCNNMSGITRSGEKYPFTIEELNKAYLDDYIINLDDIKGARIIGSHQEIDWTLIKV